VIDYVVVSCEHGGNRIPVPYRPLFQTDDSRTLLASHRGFDAGALVMAKELAKHFAAPLVTATVSRLLVDLNRSLDNPRVFSTMVRALPAATRERIVASYYRPYRARLQSLVLRGIKSGGRVVHISCHSFTPELYGEVRNADVGLLYDPARSGELEYCGRWQNSLKSVAPELKVRRNYPYSGKNDGLTRHLRQCFSADQYLGIELEINQKHVTSADRAWHSLRCKLIASLSTLVIGDRSSIRVA